MLVKLPPGGKRHSNENNQTPSLPLRSTLLFQLPESGPYTVIDSGTDQACLGKGWRIITRHEQFAHDDRGDQKQLIDAIATLIEYDEGIRKRVAVIRVNQAMHYPERTESLLPPDQMRWAGNTVNDCSAIHGGAQSIVTKDHTLRMNWDGKTFFLVHGASKESDKKLPKVELTSKSPYHPCDYVTQIERKNTWRTQTGMYEHEGGVLPQGQIVAELADGTKLEPEIVTRRSQLWNPSRHLWKPHQLAEWKLRLAAANDETVKKTFLATTQLVPSVRHENELIPKDHHVARFPMLNCRRLRETLYTDVVEHHVGSQTFNSLLCYGGSSKIMAIYPLGDRKSSQKTLEALYEFVRDFGCPEVIVSDFAAQLSQAATWKRFCTVLLVQIKSSEAHKHNSNHVERAWQSLKYKGAYIEQRNIVPDHKKFAMYKHLCDLHNHTALASLNWITPLQALTGEEPDISFLRYHFWEPVWYQEGPATFPHRKWLKGRFIGVAWNTGDLMCYAIWPDEHTKRPREIHRTLVLPRHPDENAPKELLHYRSDHFFPTPQQDPQPQVEGREELAHRVATNKRERKRKAKEAKRKRKDKKHKRQQPEVESLAEDGKTETRDDDISISTSDEKNSMETESPHGEGQGRMGPIEAALREEYLAAAEDNDRRLTELSEPAAEVLDQGKVQRITRHKKKLGDNGPELLFNIVLDSGERMNNVGYEDMEIDAPIVLANYILHNKSLQKDSNLAARAREVLKKNDRFMNLKRKMVRRYMINLDQSKDAESARPSRLTLVKTRRARFHGRTQDTGKKSNSPNKRKSNKMGTFMHGVYVPRSVEEALRVDEENGNTLWRDAIKAEIESLQSYKTFKLVRHQDKSRVRSTHQYAPLRMIFTCKPCGRRKARLVIGGHVVDAGSMDTFASNMKSISARLLMIIAAKNNLDALTGDIKSAYLCADNKLPVYCVLGKEFNVQDPTVKAGSLATVDKALYGLPPSANLWRATLSDHLRTMGFRPSRYDGDVWMRRNGRVYDYIGTHTDDLLVVSKDPRVIMDAISSKFAMSKVSEPQFHLGCDYMRDHDGVWRVGTETYVKEALAKVEEITKTSALGSAHSPMSEALKPELDDSPLLEPEEHRNFQQLIGIAQWLITCGRMDLAFAVGSLSRFSAAPRQNHLKELTRVFKYLRKYPSRWVRLDPKQHEPYGEIGDPGEGLQVNWKDYYPDATEELDPKRPDTLDMKPLDTIVYFDSNFAHDEVTRRSITGTLTLVGSAPVAHMCKRQGAIATSTYSAELCAARQGCEEAVNIRYMLTSLGIPVRGRTLLLGDNMSSLVSSTKPGSPCKKKSSAIAYHYVRECNAAGIVKIMKINTDHNLSGGFTKALSKGKFLGMFRKIFAIAPEGAQSLREAN